LWPESFWRWVFATPILYAAPKPMRSLLLLYASAAASLALFSNQRNLTRDRSGSGHI